MTARRRRPTKQRRSSKSQQQQQPAPSSSSKRQVEEETPPFKVQLSAAQKKKRRSKQDEEGQEEEETIVETRRSTKQQPVTFEPSSSDDGDASSSDKEEEQPTKKQQPTKKAPTKSRDNDDGSCSEEEEDKATAAPRSSAVKKQLRQQQKKEQREKSSTGSSGSSDDDDSGSEYEEKKKAAKLFSDENAAWLKPKEENKKQSLLPSDDEEEEEKPESDDEEDLLEIEEEAKRIDQERQLQEQEAKEEYQRQIQEETAIYHLATDEELEQNVNRVVPPSELRSHIESILEVLAEFNNRREPGRARKEYLDRLTLYLAELHGYLFELVEYFLTMFSPSECCEFLEQSDQPRPLVIRTNTLKTRRKDLAAALMKRGVTVDPLAAWSKVGLKIAASPVPIGATPEYLSGWYQLQSAASQCPVLALNPQPHERILDMAAAPGGKTTYIAQLLRNTGTVTANDHKIERQKATVANLHRLGITNAICCHYDGRKLGRLFPNRFDRVLLDAPCSGLGVISRDPSVKVQRTLKDILHTSHLQKELILSAIDALKPGGAAGGAGILVYSTCSVSVMENEQVVQYALEKRHVKLVDMSDVGGVDFGRPGFVRYQQRRFHPSMALTRRYYPHVHNMDGFFVAKLQKIENGVKAEKEEQAKQDGAAKEEGGADNDEKKGEKQKKRKDNTNNKKESEKGDETRSKSKKLDKKRKKGQEDEEEPKPKKTRQHLSVPPPQPVKKKPRQNAKVTRPRRKKL